MNRLPKGVEVNTYTDPDTKEIHILVRHPETGAEAYRRGNNKEEVRKLAMEDLENMIDFY